MNEAAIAWLAKKSFSVHREACNLTKFPGCKSAQGAFSAGGELD
jgi:hypothetical protein